ncbi:MAG: peptidoglycan DD-metalloendopeptidase family protein [Bacteroidaceae bacterium]|nr:peptidoglycan DD-metalloendopeptidase family protein [Bacteroidaceae bacterium]
MLRYFITLLIVYFFSFSAVTAQESVKEMKRKVVNLQKQIADKEGILRSSRKDVRSKMQNIELLGAQIKERKGIVNALSKEVRSLNTDIARLNAEIKLSETNVQKAREEYAAALRRVLRYGSFQDKLLFIVSADDFNTMVRRYRYTREYMNAHRDIADRLKGYIDTLEFKRSQVDSVRLSKEESLQVQNNERLKLEKLEKEQQKLLKELRRESRKVEAELKKQRNELTKLNRAIDKAIEREIAAGKSKKQQQGKVAKSSNSGKDDGIKLNDAEIKKMSGSFAQNKGKLPPPITGPYHIVGQFGPQKGVAGKGNISIDYGGVTLQGAKGAKARCVFDGLVTSVVRDDDFAFVIVRHGSYLTVYCRLSNINVKSGDKIKAGDIIGDIATDATGHTRILFQLRQEKKKLNPAQWLNM